MAKKHKKTPEEKAVVVKQKKQQKRAKRKKEARDNLTKEEILQDDRCFFIVGYTSGGAPYGVIWEEMGLEPWKDLEENNFCSWMRQKAVKTAERHYQSMSGVVCQALDFLYAREEQQNNKE